MRMPEPKVQRQLGEEKEELLQTKPLVQRRVSGSEAGLEEAPPIVHEVLRSPGRPLDAETRAFFEPRFGHDFSQVRVHADAKAAEAAAAVNARAFTVGRDVVFGRGAYAQKTFERQKLLAHELIHLVQQNQRTLSKHDTGTQDSYLKIQSKTRTKIVQRFVGPVPLGAEEAARQIVARQFTRRAAPRALWRHFWRTVIRRFALRGATMVALAAADGPLPIGELIDIGLAIWTIWEIINLWDELWEEAETIARTESVVEVDVDVEREGRRECRPTGLSPEDAIPIKWFKPIGYYPPVININGYSYHFEKELSEHKTLQSGEPIGVDWIYRPRIGKQLQLIPLSQTRDNSSWFRDVLEKYGFDWSGLQVDHVQDLEWGGPDSFENLWPMDSSANMSAGSRNNNQIIEFCPTPSSSRVRGSLMKMKRVLPQLYGRWFYIQSIEY